MRRLMTILSAVVLVFALSACEDNASSQEKESKSRQGGYDALVKNQPGKTMTYSPTRETINFWVETWNEPDKLSYVYHQNAEGRITGYYVLKGLPVSMCAAISPTYEIKYNDSAGRVVVPAPANDGVYYSGGQCNTYYGQDATTGAYIEYTVGLGINVLLYDQPLPGSIAGDAKPLGMTSVEDVKP